MKLLKLKISFKFILRWGVNKNFFSFCKLNIWIHFYGFTKDIDFFNHFSFYSNVGGLERIFFSFSPFNIILICKIIWGQFLFYFDNVGLLFKEFLYESGVLSYIKVHHDLSNISFATRFLFWVTTFGLLWKCLFPLFLPHDLRCLSFLFWLAPSVLLI